MKKSILKLGKNLTKMEQMKINGGIGKQCLNSPGVFCPIDCDCVPNKPYCIFPVTGRICHAS